MDSYLEVTKNKKLKVSAYFATILSTPVALEHKAVKWVPIQDLGRYKLLSADIPISENLIKKVDTQTDLNIKFYD